MNVVVVGSGIAGLSSALHLTHLGHQVTVFEKNDWIGGKMREFSSNGYRFDKGPSLFTLPELVDEIFELFGKNPTDYYQYVKLEEGCRYFDTNGQKLIAYSDLNKFKEEVTKKMGTTIANRVAKYIKKSSHNYILSENLFIKNDKGLLSKEGIKMMLYARQMGIFTTLNTFNSNRLDHPFLNKIFNRFATYNGSNPFKTPAVLNCIPALEHNKGTYLPTNGIYGVIKGLYHLAKEVGINFHLNTPVESLKEVKSKWQVNNKYDFDSVVINGDYFSTQKLLPRKYQKPLPETNQLSTSGVVFYWGIKKTFENLGVHNILFAKDYKKEFEELDQLKINDDLTVYIHISSKICKQDAPEGCENWFVMVNVPPKSINSELLADIRDKVIQKINHQLKTDVESLIETEEVFTPQLIQQDTSSYNGALYGYHSNSLKMMLSRPKNKSDIKGIYYAGGTVFPGGGIPLCISSGKLAANKLVAERLS